MMLPSFGQYMFALLSISFNPLWHFGSCEAQPSPSPSPSPQATPTILRRNIHPCAEIFAEARENNTQVFLASDVYSCLTNVPFHADDAKQFLQYYRDTIQFHSTLVYLKNPPASYRQPAVDLLGGLDLIESDIDLGVFENQYAFEVAVQTLIGAAHDFHLRLIGGILSVFSFASQYGLVSLSSDGVDLPKVYIMDDWFKVEYYNETDWTPSAVTSINMVNTTTYLTQYAHRNSFGHRDPQADWNDLMYSPAGNIQPHHFTAFQGGTSFYNGDTINFGFENGTSTGAVHFVAVFTDPTNALPAITNGDDMYTYYVLGLSLTGPSGSSSTSAATVAASTTAAAATTITATDPSTPTPTADFWTGARAANASWFDLAYPLANITQAYLGQSYGGVVSGYFLDDAKLGVLSIPSFDMYGVSSLQFSNTVGEFLRLAKEAGITKIVVDVQQNYGGDPLLAIDTFRHFFPDIHPFDGARSRAHDMANRLGTAFTEYFDKLSTDNDSYPYLEASVWTATDYLNARTGRNFSSWAELFGPHPDHGDQFTTIQQNNYSSVSFDEAATGGLVVYGYGNRSTTAPPPYAAEDIIILTDSQCHSACAVFVEGMHHDADVRTVAVGGRPQIGPMQAIGGTRGHLSYDDASINYDMQAFNSSFPDRNIRMWIQLAGFNLRDQIRRGENFPLQFAYEAADCRIFFTKDTLANYDRLWKYAADAIWANSSLCVPGSTGPTTTNESATTGHVDSLGTYQTPVVHAPGRPSSDLSTHIHLWEDGPVSPANTQFQPCQSSLGCTSSQTCAPVTECGSGNIGVVMNNRCLTKCSANNECTRNDYRWYTCQEGICKPAPQSNCDDFKRTGRPRPPMPRFKELS